MRTPWQRLPERTTLANLRRKLQVGQQELATELGKSAAATHKAEHSVDPQMSTLTSYIKALGRITNREASVSVIVQLGKDSWTLELLQCADEASLHNDAAQEHQHGKKEKAIMDTTTTADDRAQQIVKSLDARLVTRTRRDVDDLVARTRQTSRRQVLVGHHASIGEFFTAFARSGGRRVEGGIYYGGRTQEPGLWHALQVLHKLDYADTAMWNDLRKEVVAQLDLNGTWQRIGSSPRGSEFFIPDR